MKKIKRLKLGTKVKFLGVPEFYYPCFLDVAQFAKENLKKGQEYTILKHEVHSSWQSIVLQEFPFDLDKNSERFFHLAMFEVID